MKDGTKCLVDFGVKPECNVNDVVILKVYINFGFFWQLLLLFCWPTKGVIIL